MEEHVITRDAPIWSSSTRTARHVDACALRCCYGAACDEAYIHPTRFSDLRHTFGSLAINRSIVRGQGVDGPADIRTTAR